MSIWDPVGLVKLESTVRRLYLIVLFGVGGIVVLASLIGVLYTALDDLLGNTLGRETLWSMRVGLSLLIAVTGVAWYHLAVFRSDRATLAALTPAVAPPPSRHVVLITPRDFAPPDATLADRLAAATGADLETWYRTDRAPMPEIDVARLTAEIEASEAHDMLVVVGPSGATLTPFETDE